MYIIYIIYIFIITLLLGATTALPYLLPQPLTGIAIRVIWQGKPDPPKDFIRAMRTSVKLPTHLEGPRIWVILTEWGQDQHYQS